MVTCMGYATDRRGSVYMIKWLELYIREETTKNAILNTQSGMYDREYNYTVIELRGENE